jgi:hypothetical protein
MEWNIYKYTSYQGKSGLDNEFSRFIALEELSFFIAMGRTTSVASRIQFSQVQPHRNHPPSWPTQILSI